MSYGQRKWANGELLSYFQAEAPMYRPSFFFTYDKRQDKYLSKFYTYDRVVIHIKLGQFLHLKIIVNIFCETLYGLNFTLTIIFYSMNFCEKGCRFLLKVIHVKWTKSVLKFIQLK